METNAIKDSDMAKRQLISTTKAAERLNVSPNTVRAFIADGRFKGFKVGRLVKVDSNEIDAYLDRVATNS
jgi:excisionase family DNA binding protein